MALAALAWGLTALAVVVYSVWKPHHHTLFDLYADASRSWWAGRDLYADGTASEFRYSPLFAVAFTPFALVEPPWGGSVWKAFGIACYLAALMAFGRRVLGLGPGSERLSWLLVVALPLSAISLFNGQANLVVMALVLLALCGVGGARPGRAAVWLAAAALVKGYPLVLVLLLSAVVSLGLLWRTALALVAGLALPLLTVPFPRGLLETQAWVALLHDTTGVRKPGYRSFDQLCRVVGFPLSPEAHLVIALITGALTLWLCLAFSRRHEEKGATVVYTLQLWAVWTVLFGPAAEAATYVLLAPGLAWALVEAFHRPGSRAERTLLVTSALLIGPLATDLFGGPVRRFAVDHGGLPLGGLLFLAWLASRPWSAPRLDGGAHSV